MKHGKPTSRIFIENDFPSHQRVHLAINHFGEHHEPLFTGYPIQSLYMLPCRGAPIMRQLYCYESPLTTW